MATTAVPTSPFTRVSRIASSYSGSFVMALIIIILGAYLIGPVLWLMVQSFNVNEHPLIGDARWGLDNWRVAFSQPRMWTAIGNSFLVWVLTMVASFPVAITVSWVLARTRLPFGHFFEVMFWISFMMPNISNTIAWIALLDPQLGLLNKLVAFLPFVEQGPFNIFSVPGIVWAHLMANGISFKVMLLTPAFRGMDASLEEAARVSGASNLRTMLRVTLPLMISPMVLVLALQMLRIFQSFETEQLLGTPFGFFVYSTLIFHLVRVTDVPQYGSAVALGSITLVVVALIIPLQRWILTRRRYTTITAGYRPGLIDLGPWKWVAVGAIAFVIFSLTLLPFLTVILGSFMFRSGYFNISPIFTLDHWTKVLTQSLFLTAIRTTLLLAFASAILSPLLFATLAYILVKTRWLGRGVLDMIIWSSSAVPGMLAGLGLLVAFLGTPGLNLLYGTVWALILVVVIQGNTTGINISKASIVQVGNDMEEAARVSGAGWFRTFWRIWIPLLMPTLVMLFVLNFTVAASTTSSIILLADRGTITLSILALDLGRNGEYEEASIISILLIILTVGISLVARRLGMSRGVRIG